MLPHSFAKSTRQEEEESSSGFAAVCLDHILATPADFGNGGEEMVRHFLFRFANFMHV